MLVGGSNRTVALQPISISGQKGLNLAVGVADAPDPVEFRSLDPAIRHICGHDLHTTIGLALADGTPPVGQYLLRRQKRFDKGT